MYTNKDNIKIIVDLLKKNDICDLVISPGGTNIELIKAVQNDNFFHCYSIVDERSAAYFAIGIYLQRGKPVGLICTSAQATRNYIPGLTEAFYKKVPLLAITMEKHPRFKYQEYMQAPDQTSLPNDSVKKSFELPFISDINDFYHSLRIVNQAILELTLNGNGPVQLCVPWLDFPINDQDVKIRSIKRYNCSNLNKIIYKNKRILIVIGEHRPFTKSEKESIDFFCENTNAVIYTNHLSNFRNSYSINGNLLLSTLNIDEFKSIEPDILISIGNQTGDYPFYLMLSKPELDKVEHWRICDDGEVIDTYDKLTKIFQGNLELFFTNAEKQEIDHEFYRIWVEKNKNKTNQFDVPFSNVYIAQQLHDKIPKSSIIQFSILNSLRTWNLFDLDSSVKCYSNVGAFGIDGGMSTLIGQSVVTENMSFMIIGDLAFFYDMNSLGIKHIKNNLRILLINNNGGVEFKLHGEKKEIVDNYISASNHNLNSKGWAKACGFDYYSAKSKDEFNEVAKIFVSNSPNPIVLEVFVTDYDESKAYQKIIDKNRNKTKKEIIKQNLHQSIKNIVGPDTYKDLRKMIKGQE